MGMEVVAEVLLYLLDYPLAHCLLAHCSSMDFLSLLAKIVLAESSDATLVDTAR